MQIDFDRGAEVGVVVRDLEPVVELYTKGFGLGPFEVEELDAPTARYRDAPQPTRLRVASAPLGVCEMELIEVLAGRPPHADFLDSHGEGMNHLNLDKLTHEGYLSTLGELYFRGIEPFWGLPFNSFCYVESEEIGGVTFEVMVGSGHAGKKGHNHLGLVVADTDRTIDFYTHTMGLGPFRTGDYPTPRAFYRDARIEADFRASFCDLGQARLRLYQVLEGENPLLDQLNTTGEGMHHLCLAVADLDQALAVLRAAGIPTAWICPEARMAFVDSTRVGGMVFALRESASDR
jgi:catechol 2,3-dioxygenase-like lactoylglutathione lyase family enzyme